MSQGWRWRGLCSIYYPEIQAPPSSGFANSRGPGVLHCIIRTLLAEERGEHGAVGWMFYTPGLNMVDFISGHTVHWAQLVTRRHLSAKEAGKRGLSCAQAESGTGFGEHLALIVSATYRFSKSLLFTMVTSKVCMVPACAFV